jgi:hypothetical protein
VGQDAAEPGGEPRTLDEIRIAHNLAVSRGDEAQAARWRERLLGHLNRAPATRFGDSLRLMGVNVIDGAEPRVESWFEVLAPPSGDYLLGVRSTITARSRWSLIPDDSVDRPMASTSHIATRLWRRGFIYAVETDLNHRIGREEYWAKWVSADGKDPPRRSDGKPETLLVVRD